MAKCHNEECTKTDLKPEQLFQEHGTGNLFCEECSVGKIMKTNGEENGLVLGRRLDYGASYTRKDGFRAHARLGGAKVSLEIDQAEFFKVLGPED